MDVTLDRAKTMFHYSRLSGAELVFSCHAARTYPWHVHTRHWTAGFVCSGKALLETGSGRRILGEGDSFVVPVNVAHALATSDRTVLAVLCLTPDRDSRVHVQSLLKAGETERGDSLFDHLTRRDVFALQRVAGRLMACAEFERPEERLSPAVGRVVTMLRDHPEKSFPLEAMAAQAGYSRWHFLRLFQRETGLTPHAYQMNCRLSGLRTLLRAGTSTADAAVSAGFSDQSHMHKLFRRHHGLTPKQFRQASIMSAW